jgi:integrase
MPVVARGNSYQATVHHKGQRHRKSFRSKAEAEAWEAQIKASLLRGESITEDTGSVNTGPQTLTDLFEITYQRFWKGAKSEKSSRINAMKCVEALGPTLAPGAVTEQRIDEMIFLFEREGIADATINRRLSALSKMLTFAAERGYIVRKPKIDRKKEPEHRIRYLTEQEEQDLIGYMTLIEKHDMVDIIKVAIDTGMRMGEILKVQVRDLSDGLITLWETKSGKARSIPLTQRAREVLERRAQEAGEGKLFEGWTHSMIRHYWDAARSHMGLMRDPQFVPHAMRHTFCSRLVQRGVDITTISKLAGHSSVVVTMRYAHLSPDNLVSAIRALESVNSADDVNPQERTTPHHCGVTVA